MGAVAQKARPWIATHPHFDPLQTLLTQSLPTTTSLGKPNLVQGNRYFVRGELRDGLFQGDLSGHIMRVLGSNVSAFRRCVVELEFRLQMAQHLTTLYG